MCILDVVTQNLRNDPVDAVFVVKLPPTILSQFPELVPKLEAPVSTCRILFCII